MFDYDDLWEPSPDDPKSQFHADDADISADRICLVARHAVQGTELKVVVPKKAKFKHVKKAIARRLGNSAEVLEKIQLLDKVQGVYTAYRDRDPVGELKEVLVLGIDLTVAEGARRAAALSDSDISEEERKWVTVEYVGNRHKASTSSAQPRHKASNGERDSGKGRRQPAKAIAHFGGDMASSWQLSRAGGLGAPRPQAPALRTQQAPEPEPPQPEHPLLTKAQAMDLQLELYEGFKDEDFQEELRLLEREAPHMSRTDFIKARQELFFAVQCQVLPRYGFEDTQEGVYKMMAAMGPFLNDPDFVKMAEKVNEVVGVNNPRERWGSLQRACEKWDFVEGTASAKPP